MTSVQWVYADFLNLQPAKFIDSKMGYNDSQGGRGNFTYLLEGQIHFSLKLFVGRPIKQFWMLFSLIFLLSFDQHVFLQFYYKTIILPKIAKFQVRSFEK